MKLNDTIDARDISIVVQGDFRDKSIIPCIKSLNKYLPEAQLIVSTWDHCDLTLLNDLKIDDLVVNEMPPAISNVIYGDVILKHIRHEWNSTNRSIIGVKFGLEKVNRRFTLKVRADSEIRSLDFINYFRLELKRDNNYKVFQERIVCQFAYSPTRFAPYMVGDHFFFGLTEDIFALWDVGLIPDESEIMQMDFEDLQNFYIVPESIITRQALAKKLNFIPRTHPFKKNKNSIKLSEKCIVNNFMCLSAHQFRIYADFQGIVKRCGEGLAEPWLKHIFYSKMGDAYKHVIAFPEYIRWYIDHCGGAPEDFFEIDKQEFEESVDLVDALKLIYDPSPHVVFANKSLNKGFSSIDSAKVKTVVSWLKKMNKNNIVERLKELVEVYDDPIDNEFYIKNNVF
jgi:hypothetical protein